MKILALINRLLGPATQPAVDERRDAGYRLLELAGYSVLRAPLPGGRQMAVVFPPDMAPLDAGESDELWTAVEHHLAQLTETFRVTQRLRLEVGAGVDGAGKQRH